MLNGSTMFDKKTPRKTKKAKRDETIFYDPTYKVGGRLK